MKILIFGTMFVSDPEKARLLDMWAELMHRKNPECHWLLVDAPSPPEWLEGSHALKDCARFQSDQDELFDHRLTHRHTLVSFAHNVGHLGGGGRDGWGRAFCQGLHLAITNGYDYAVHIESDLLCRLKVREICAMMERHSLAVLATLARSYGFLETGVMFMNAAAMRDMSFIARYDWKNRTPWPYPEIIIEAILGDNAFYKNWRGFRDDFSAGKVEEAGSLDFVTHSRPLLYEAFMAADRVADEDSEIDRGERLLESGDQAGALQVFEEVLQRAPASSRALNDAGVLCFQMGRPEEALRYLKLALVQQPDNANTLINMFYCLLGLKQFDALIELVTRLKDHLSREEMEGIQRTLASIRFEPELAGG